MVEVKEVPTSVKVISVMFFIGAAVLIIVAGGALFFEEIIRTLVYSRPDIPTTTIPQILVYILLGMFNIIVGIYLWKLKDWARITVIIVTGLGTLILFVSTISLMITTVSGTVFVEFWILFLSLILLLVTATIFFYLLFNKKIKEAFSSNLPQTS